MPEKCTTRRRSTQMEEEEEEEPTRDTQPIELGRATGAFRQKVTIH